MSKLLRRLLQARSESRQDTAKVYGHDMNAKIVGGLIRDLCICIYIYIYLYLYICVYVFMYHVYNVYYQTETCCPRRAHAIHLTQLSMSGCSAGQINTNDAASSEGPHELALGRDSQSCAVQVRWEHGLGKKIVCFSI